MISKYDLNVYSEDLAPVSEAEHDEIMALMAEEAEGFEGYGQWSANLDNSAENFTVQDGKVRHKPQPPSKRLNGFEL